MLNLRHFGIKDAWPSQESVSILVGPNGSGKSSFLRNLAKSLSENDNVLIICNTPHDRFSGLRAIRRLSAGKPSDSPKNIVKTSVLKALNDPGSAFYQISSILEFCGYKPRFGFSIKTTPKYC